MGEWLLLVTRSGKINSSIKEENVRTFSQLSFTSFANSLSPYCPFYSPAMWSRLFWSLWFSFSTSLFLVLQLYTTMTCFMFSNILHTNIILNYKLMSKYPKAKYEDHNHYTVFLTMFQMLPTQAQNCSVSWQSQHWMYSYKAIKLLCPKETFISTVALFILFKICNQSIWAEWMKQM